MNSTRTPCASSTTLRCFPEPTACDPDVENPWCGGPGSDDPGDCPSREGGDYHLCLLWAERLQDSSVMWCASPVPQPPPITAFVEVRCRPIHYNVVVDRAADHCYAIVSDSNSGTFTIEGWEKDFKPQGTLVMASKLGWPRTGKGNSSS